MRFRRSVPLFNPIWWAFFCRWSGLVLLMTDNHLGGLIVHATDIQWHSAEGGGGTDDPAKSSPVSGPLPLSRQIRQQLMQLDQVIQESPNPGETILRVAEANQMDPQDLMAMIERNRNDMAKAGGGGGAPSSANRVAMIIHFVQQNLLLVLWQYLRQYPRRSAFMLLVVIAMLYVATEIPRTGWVYSHGRSWISHGPTTLWSPPTTFVQRQHDFWSIPAIPTSPPDDEVLQAFDQLLLDQEEHLFDDEKEQSLPIKGKNTLASMGPTTTIRAKWHVLGKKIFTKAHISQAVSAQSKIDLVKDLGLPVSLFTHMKKPSQTQSSRENRTSVMSNDDNSSGSEAEYVNEGKEESQSIYDGDDDEGVDEGENPFDADIDLAMDIAMEQARKLLGDVSLLTEFVPPPIHRSIRFVSVSKPSQDDNDDKFYDDNDDESAVLVMRGMGDWGRYGLLPVEVTGRHDDLDSDPDHVRLILSTAAGGKRKGYFDGTIVVEIQRKYALGAIRICVGLIVPKGGHKVPSRKVAMRLVECVCQSIHTSLKTRTKQSWMRRQQSKGVAQWTHKRAQQRRQLRFHKEQAMEDMAADRRRRWQRQNPNAGHYRPSGKRMQSPNNAVYQ